MLDRVVFGKILVMLSLIPLAFLVYTLMSLDELKITLTHPRVMVELSLFLTLLIIGILLRFQE